MSSSGYCGPQAPAHFSLLSLSLEGAEGLFSSGGRPLWQSSSDLYLCPSLLPPPPPPLSASWWWGGSWSTEVNTRSILLSEVGTRVRAFLLLQRYSWWMDVYNRWAALRIFVNQTSCWL